MREALIERYLTEASVCPQCGKRMAALGLDFRAPGQGDTEAWDILAVLHEHGFAFRGCGCSVGYAPPARRSEAMRG